MKTPENGIIINGITYVIAKAKDGNMEMKTPENGIIIDGKTYVIAKAKDGNMVCRTCALQNFCSSRNIRPCYIFKWQYDYHFVHYRG